jgi:phage tail-like protein
MAVVDPYEPALALRFSVQIGGHWIDRFIQCDGLTAEYEVDEYREGGQGGFVHRLPVRLKHTNVRLIRPIDKDSGAIAAWFTATSQRPERQDATITAYDGAHRPVASWNLVGAWPVKYTGPSLLTTSVLAATETVELAHNGFSTKALP